jgi:hypothetical protein
VIDTAEKIHKKATVLEHAITVVKPLFVVGVGRGDQVEEASPFGLIGQALDQLLNGNFSGSLALDADGGEADLSAQNRFYCILRSVRKAAPTVTSEPLPSSVKAESRGGTRPPRDYAFCREERPPPAIAPPRTEHDTMIL